MSSWPLDGELITRMQADCGRRFGTDTQWLIRAEIS